MMFHVIMLKFMSHASVIVMVVMLHGIGGCMVIKQARVKMTEFCIPENPCKRCGTRKRYKSTRDCVACVRVRDAARTDDRRSHRLRCEVLLRRTGVSLDGLSRQEKDDLIAANFPFMGAYLTKKFGYKPL